MTATERDFAFMSQALRLARRGLFTTDPNPRVGCVIVSGDAVVGRGWHARAGGPHAERVALADAGAAARGATAYVTLEPCCHQGRTPPCTEALLAAGIARVVIGSGDPDPRVAGGGQRSLEAAGVALTTGVMAAEADALNTGFRRRMQTGRPWVRVKIAASLDGRTALANGTSQWITSPAARADVQRLRARSSAIMTGVGTVIADDPSLNVRDAALGDVLQPLRVVVDSRLRMPPSARTLALAGDVLVLTCTTDAAAVSALERAGAMVECVAGDAAGRVDLAGALDRLAERGVNELLVEAGATLNGALLEAGLIDELVVYMAGSVLGNGARGLFDIADLDAMSDRAEFELAGVRRVGRDLRLHWARATETD